MEDLKSQVTFLKNTVKGLEDENVELRQILFGNASVYEDLRRAHRELQKKSDKSDLAHQSQLAQMEEKLQKLSDQASHIKMKKVRKPYHQLASAQQKRVRREVREVMAPELNHYFNDRNLTCARLVLDDVNGEKESVQVQVTPHHKYEDLTPIEKQTVQRFSDARSTNLVSDESYASFRRINSSIPPLTHLKQYDQEVIAEFPPLIDAPGRTGAFFPLRPELGNIAVHLVKKGELVVGTPLKVKMGADATKYNHISSICVYTAALITETVSEIAVVGCVLGGDGTQDMDETATPFFEQVKELALNPSIKTPVGEFLVTIYCGGDLCNILAQYGLASASSNYPCPICVCHRSLFATIPFQPQLLRDCNSSTMARTRGNIFAEAAKSKPSFGVKNAPLSPIPISLNMPLISVILYDSLHALLRLTSISYINQRMNQLMNV